MTTTYYHGTTADITAIDRDICLTVDAKIAESYLDGAAGYVYEITVGGVTFADEDDIRDAAAAVARREPDGEVALLLRSGAWVYQLIDEQPVRDELADRGYGAAKYPDASLFNEAEHDTFRLFSGGGRVTGRREMN